MKFSKRDIHVLVTLCVLAVLAGGVYHYFGADFVSHSHPRPVPITSPSPTAQPSANPHGLTVSELFSQAVQLDTGWARGYKGLGAHLGGSFVVEPPQRDTGGWTFQVQSKGNIYTPSNSSFCGGGGPNLSGSPYTAKVYHHSLKVGVTQNARTGGPTFTIVTRPSGTAAETVHC